MPECTSHQAIKAGSNFNYQMFCHAVVKNQYALEFPAKQKTGKSLQIHSNKTKTVQMNSREKFASELVGRIFAGTSDWSYILYGPAKILTRVQPFFGKQNLRIKKSLICLTGEMKAIHIDQACGVSTYLHNHITPCPTNMISIFLGRGQCSGGREGGGRGRHCTMSLKTVRKKTNSSLLQVHFEEITGVHKIIAVIK